MSRLRILFLCTGNSARSILAEYLLRHRAPDRFETVSAGAAPKGEVHSLALEILRTQFGIDASAARSKSWREFEGQRFEFLITLCDRARESCPAWAGQPVTAHWGLPDPAAVEGTVAVRRQAFLDVATQINRRIDLLTALRAEQLDALRLSGLGLEA